MFVDDEKSFAAYKAVGFNQFTDNFMKTQELAKIKNFALPQLSFGKWMEWKDNFEKMSPDNPWTFPEGVRQVGGTFVVSGDNVVYQWNDRVPGDHPNIQQVVAVAKEAAR
eukprot:gnl/MRDRNA2_/MRDRNA2_111216_c0_seq1.p2 gnl/MRDRNA2_/MRDRNA2_111216_c0~~gnl/MRDRNA2_/MRDRNA2_111216_c0_seq1.p2  ORF type:complete len:110 (-),score=25.32 gnl/MRDRNA2_/MRDRNA2_111216_c0_seq1:215-544(-)